MPKNKIQKFVLLVLSLVSLEIQGQESLTLNQFMTIVKTFHPTVRQSRLQNQITQNQILAAKGQLDPKLSAKAGEKNIGGVGYYRQQSLNIELPTWYGLNLIGEVKNLEGQKLDLSDTKGTLQQIGVEIPLAKGLLFDQRRASIQQARLFAQMTENEQNLLINDLLLKASQAYIEWWKSHQILTINRNGYQNNKQRLKMIQKTYELGERPAIDTVEAAAQMQLFELKVNEAETHFKNATLQLSVFLWDDHTRMVMLPSHIVPEDLSETPSPESEHSLPILANHNALLYYNKQDFLQVEKKLKFQSLLPKLDLVYHFIRKDQWQFFPVFRESFQYGIKLEIPIFLRTERAHYENAKLKLLQNELDLALKQNELDAKLQQYRNEQENYHRQEGLAQKNILLYEQLLRGEHLRFLNGDGSVFLINARETKLLEAKEKLTEIQAKQWENHYKLQWIRNELISTL